MGAVTGKGLSDLIREEFGFRVTFLLMIALIVTNFGNVVGGVRRRREQPRAVRHLEIHRRAAGGVRRLGCSSCTAPTAASRRSSSSASAFYVCYIVVGRAGASRLEGGGAVARSRGPRASASATTAICRMIDRAGRHDHRAVDAVLPAGVDRREGRHRAAVPRVAAGTSSSAACSPPSSRGSSSSPARRRCTRSASTTSRPRADAAQALRPLAGEYAYLLFAAGLFNASLFAASHPADLDGVRGLRRAGVRVGTRQEVPTKRRRSTGCIRLLIVVGAGVSWFRDFPLFTVMVLSQVANGVLLPFVLIFMLLLTNDQELMGDYTQFARVQHRRRGSRWSS